MVIKVDQEAKEIITQLCDLALKTAGIKNLDVVSEVLNKMEIIREPKKSVEDVSTPKT